MINCNYFNHCLIKPNFTSFLNVNILLVSSLLYDFKLIIFQLWTKQDI